MIHSILISIFCSSALAKVTYALRPSADVLRRSAARVVALDTRRQLVGATPAVIDSLLALYSDSVTYEDPNVGDVLRGKQTMRAGVRNYLGSIRAVRAGAPRVIAGNGVVIWETTTQMEFETALSGRRSNDTVSASLSSTPLAKFAA